MPWATAAPSPSALRWEELEERPELVLLVTPDSHTDNSQAGGMQFVPSSSNAGVPDRRGSGGPGQLGNPPVCWRGDFAKGGGGCPPLSGLIVPDLCGLPWSSVLSRSKSCNPVGCGCCRKWRLQLPAPTGPPPRAWSRGPGVHRPTGVTSVAMAAHHRRPIPQPHAGSGPFPSSGKPATEHKGLWAEDGGQRGKIIRKCHQSF